MKRYSSAPCLADIEGDSKRIKSNDVESEPNAREYLQLALARVLELQREIKDGTYTAQSEHISNHEESSSDDDLTKEVLCKVFKNLPGTPNSIGTIIDDAIKPKLSQLDDIRNKRIQLLGYDTCRRSAVDFMKNAVRDSILVGSNSKTQNYPDFRVGTYSRREPRIAHRRTGLLLKESRKSDAASPYDHEIRNRMLRSLDLHLAAKQRDYTAKLMRSAI